MTIETPRPDEIGVDELRLALDNRVAALATLHERALLLEAERAALESRVAEAEQERELAAVADDVLSRKVNDLEHQLRMVEHAASVQEFELRAELHEAREQLAAATQRAVAAEQHPLRQLLTRLRSRLPGS